MAGAQGSRQAIVRARAEQRRQEQPPTVKVYRVDNMTFVLGIIMTVMALMLMWNCGQMCQKAKNDGMSIGTANAKVTANAAAYDRGYADAVWDYQHPEEA